MTPTIDHLDQSEEQARAQEARRQQAVANAIAVTLGILLAAVLFVVWSGL